MNHPNDDTGDDLTRARNIDFSVVFPNQFNAERFAENVVTTFL